MIVAVLLPPVIILVRSNDIPTTVTYGLIAALAILMGRSAFVMPLLGRLSMKNMLWIGVLSGLAIITVPFAIDTIVTIHPVSTDTPVPNTMLLLLLAPFVESYLIQGRVFSFARRYLPCGWAVTCTMCAFITIHLSINVTIVFAAIVLTIIRSKTQSLGAVIIAHSVANAVVLAVATIR